MRRRVCWISTYMPILPILPILTSRTTLPLRFDSLRSSQNRSATVESNHASASDDVDKSNFPQLIVSGGGGAFLHPTHTFANSIKVNFGGSLWKNYQRKVAYPSESACYRLSWLNIWQFRWR